MEEVDSELHFVSRHVQENTCRGKFEPFTPKSHLSYPCKLHNGNIRPPIRNRTPGHDEKLVCGAKASVGNSLTFRNG